MVKHIHKISKKIRKKERIPLIIQSAACFILILLVFVEVQWKHIKIDNQLRDLNANNTYSLCTPDAINEISTDTFKQLYLWINSEFNYQICDSSKDFSAKMVDGSDFPEKFKKGYEEGSDLSEEAKNAVDEMVKNCVYKRISVNDNFVKHNCFKVSEGRLFNEGDYECKKDLIPVILGSEYRNYVKLEDILNTESQGDAAAKSYQVVGFLQEDSYFMSPQDGHSLVMADRYVIAPWFKADDSSMSAKECRYYYFRGLMGMIQYDDTYSEQNERYLQDLIKRKSIEFGCKEDDTFSIVVRESNLSMLGAEGEQLEKIFNTFVGFMFISLLVCMSLAMATKVLALKRFYAICIANGASKYSIYGAIIREIFTINAIPFFITFLIALFMGFPLFLNLSLFLAYLVICMVSAVYPCMVFKRINIAKTLSGDH